MDKWFNALLDILHGVLELLNEKINLLWKYNSHVISLNQRNENLGMFLDELGVNKSIKYLLKLFLKE